MSPIDTPSLLVNPSTSGEIDPDVSLSVEMPKPIIVQSSSECRRKLEAETFIEPTDVRPLQSCCDTSPRHRQIPLIEWVSLLVKCQRSGIRYDPVVPGGYLHTVQASHVNLYR